MFGRAAPNRTGVARCCNHGMRRGGGRFGTAWALAVVALLALAGGAEASAGSLRIETVSARSDLVTGGDALVAVDVPDGTAVNEVRVQLNGRGVSSAFPPKAADPQRLVGLLTGLRSGSNLVSARVVGSSRVARRAIYVSPLAGPLFSGPHQAPFICTTEAAGLGPPADADCSASTQVAYYYRSTGNSWKPLADPTSRPPDMARTTTRDGRTVDYEIRLESGVINRSIYRWAILAPGGRTGVGWNQRLIYSFGGGCGAGYQQGSNGVGSVLDNRQLSRGYSVVSSSLTVLGTACNDVLSAETVEMTKEHVIESLGRAPVWTLGEGGSGGSVQAQMLAQNYPGLLDGLLVSASFPDNSARDYPDCRLLNAYFGSAAGSGLTGAQREAITGLATPNGCTALGAGADVVNATEGCDESVVPPSLIYNAQTNPGGARCTIWDSMVNVYGRDPQTGFARRTLDNTGVEYGLEALRAGAITPDQFLDVNDGIGGYDNDGNLVAQRSVADPAALEILYHTGRVNQGAGGVPEVPILDTRTYVDDAVNVHQYVNTFKFRARLRETNGTAANQVMWRAKGGQNVSAMQTAAIDTIGAWLDRIEADSSSKPLRQKVIDDKPGDAVDACWMNGGQRIDDPAEIGDTGPCSIQYPPHGLPALEAGQPLGSFVAKCHLAPINDSDYPALSGPQLARLRSIFPNGVCDYSQPGGALAGTWREFGPGRMVRTRKRALRLRVMPARRSRVRLEARLGPCPAVRWQAVELQARVRGHWRRAKRGIASGSDCHVDFAVKRQRAKTRYRAAAPALTGFKAVRSQVRKLGTGARANHRA